MKITVSKKYETKSLAIKEAELGKPIEGYQDIRCPFGSVDKLPSRCFEICGLMCARYCARLPKEMCEGCPCGLLQ